MCLLVGNQELKKLTKRCLRWPSEGWSSEGWRWSSGALKSFLLLEVSPCISMITTFNTLHCYSLVHFELGHSLSFMPCFVITVLLKMYQQLLHQATYEQVRYSKLDKFFSRRANVLVNKVFTPLLSRWWNQLKFNDLSSYSQLAKAVTDVLPPCSAPSPCSSFPQQILNAVITRLLLLLGFSHKHYSTSRFSPF